MGEQFSIHRMDSDPFYESIKGFFERSFARNAKLDNSALLDSLTRAFLSTNQRRYGPEPSPESLVAIRRVIMKAIETKQPIPVLVPWGGKKSFDGHSIDVAEVSALKQLACLSDEVETVYRPGLDIRIRIEDIGAYYLFAERGEDYKEADNQVMRESVAKYTTDFENLINVLSLPITPVPESILVSEADYIRASEKIRPLLVSYITDSDAHGLDDVEQFDSWKALTARGWVGKIPFEQRQYYRDRYRRFNPGITPRESTEKMARYFAGAIARYQVGSTGAHPSWGSDYIRVTFVPPVPGAPRDLIARDIYYRTVPLRYAATHMPPWRSRGYFKINGEAVPKLANWYDDLPFHFTSVRLVRGSISVDIVTPFILE